MKTIKKNEAFKCINCGKDVIPIDNGSSRNHCPFCLTSLHLDIVPGDRLNNCKGLMIAIGLEYNSKKGYQIIHKCSKCHHINRNKVAENCTQPDNMDKLLELSRTGAFK